MNSKKKFLEKIPLNQETHVSIYKVSISIALKEDEYGLTSSKETFYIFTKDEDFIMRILDSSRGFGDEMDMGHFEECLKDFPITLAQIKEFAEHWSSWNRFADVYVNYYDENSKPYYVHIKRTW